MTKEELQLIISGDNRGATGALAATGKAVSTFADGTVGHFRRVAGGVFNLQSALAGLAVAGTLKSILDPAVEMETFRAQLANMLGSVEAAQARLAEVDRLASSTPFELPELVAASKTLQTFTGDALSGADGLRLIGDVAADLDGKPIRELALWVGRLYDGIQSGGNIGDALARLQEMAVVSGSVRREIEALRAANGSSAAVWALVEKALKTHEGGMERLAQTTAGLKSTLSDAWTGVRRDIGEGALPALNDALRQTIAHLDEMREAGDLGDWGERIGESIATVTSALLSLTQFVGDHSEILKTLGLSYVVLRIVASARQALADLAVQLGTTASAARVLQSVMSSLGRGLVVGGMVWVVGKLRELADEARNAKREMDRLTADGTQATGKLADYNAKSDWRAGLSNLMDQIRYGGMAPDALAIRTTPPPRAPGSGRKDDEAAAEVKRKARQEADAAKAAGATIRAILEAELKKRADLAEEQRKLLAAEAELKDAYAREEREQGARNAQIAAQDRVDERQRAVDDLRQGIAQMDAQAAAAKEAADKAWDALLNPQTKAERRAAKEAEREESKLERALKRARAVEERSGFDRVSKRGQALIQSDNLRQQALDAQAAADGQKDVLATEESLLAIAQEQLRAKTDAAAEAMGAMPGHVERAKAAIDALTTSVAALVAAQNAKLLEVPTSALSEARDRLPGGPDKPTPTEEYNAWAMADSLARGRGVPDWLGPQIGVPSYPAGAAPGQDSGASKAMARDLAAMRADIAKIAQQGLF